MLFISRSEYTKTVSGVAFFIVATNLSRKFGHCILSLDIQVSRAQSRVCYAFIEDTVNDGVPFDRLRHQ